MQFKGIVATLALTAMAANAAPVKTEQEIDIDQALDYAESRYNDPQFVQSYGSKIMSSVSDRMTETNPSEADVYLAFLSMKADMRQRLMIDAFYLMSNYVSQLGVGGQAGSQNSQMISHAQNKSVTSRMNDMINKMLDKVAEDYKDGDIGTPTAATDDDDKSETSGASSKTIGMFVITAGAVAGAMVAFF
ncbi:hypothetical protein GGH96_000335 [Coemansia sp. RSA 1972]|nr:hypothetical protein GGH96_000335 [Coemansia sp. RSA 1972]